LPELELKLLFPAPLERFEPLEVRLLLPALELRLLLKPELCDELEWEE
jgi:hypothetical protein